MFVLMTIVSVICANADYNSARNNYDEEVGLEYFERGNFTLALPMLQRAAKGGSLAALDALGKMYENGLGVTADKTIMMNMYTKAVAKDYAPSIRNLASYYYSTGNIPKAIELWEKGDKNRDPFCIMKLGRCYELGVGVTQDDIQAESYYRKASDISDIYKEDLASIYFRRGDWGSAFGIYWDLYNSGGHLSDMAAAELAMILASENSLNHRNPSKEVAKAATSPIEMGKELNVAKAAQIWLSKVLSPNKITSSLHSMAPIEINWDNNLNDFPKIKECIEEYRLASEKLQEYTGTFPMSQLKRFPEMTGGDEKYADWICYNMRYPIEENGEKKNGRVIVAGVMGYDGKFMHPTVIKGGTAAMNQEALRLAKNLPLFKPGGISTNCLTYFAIPIVFNPDTYAPWRSMNAEAANSDEVCVNPDTPASFPGGMTAVMQWLASKIIYPGIARIEKIQGKVVVQFIIEKDGSIGNVVIYKGRDRTLDREAIRVVKEMPAWIPATYNGSAVRTRITLPITFKL